jgi:cytochrome c-type biogenesis protein
MIHDVSIPAALIAGVISFLSPCVLPLVPPYLIYLTGATIEHVATGEQTAVSKRGVMVSAVMFVFGLSTVFIALGAGASVIGGLILPGRRNSRSWLTRIAFLMREGRLSIPKPVGLGGAYVMGLAFAFGWTPCIGPILAAILSVAASGERRARNGCIDGADWGRVSDRQHVQYQHLAAGDVSGAAEFRLTRNNSTLRDETPAPYHLDFD